MLGMVKGCSKRDEKDKLLGHWRRNPMLDTSICEVKFDDGSIENYFANQIAKELYQRVDTWLPGQ